MEENEKAVLKEVTDKTTFVGAKGRGRGSKVKCDAELIETLLPLSTVQFNRQIKARQITEDVVAKLKEARRKIKNTRSAQRRRLQGPGRITAQAKRIEELEERCAMMEETIALLREELKERSGGSGSTTATPLSPNTV